MSAVRRWFAPVVVVLAILLLAVGAVSILPPFQSRAGLYLADRNIGLAILLGTLLVLRWTRALGAVLLATVAIHLVDGLGDLAFGNLPAAAGSVVLAALSAVSAVALLRK
jgi:hypothetical protein